MEVITDRARLEEIFNRGLVAEILPSKEELFKRLQSGARLKIYLGADPTADSLHLSHAKNYWFLEELRQLGHETIILVGDFTAQIGDPAGRSEVRPPLSADQVETNVKSWLVQLKPLMNFADRDNPPRIVYNSKWLAKLTLKEVVTLAAQFTVQQMIERDMFKKRWRGRQPIYLHEFLYPLMQGYDSVVLEVDAELCGTDQIFNSLAGRTLLKRIKNKDKFVIALNLMANPRTGELMSKSRGVGVFLSSPPNQLYGAIMAQPDEMTEVLFINCTRLPLSEKGKIMSLGPRAAKARVAFEIARKLFGVEAAKLAADAFNQTFREGGVPEDLMEINLSPGASVAEALVARGVVASKTDWRRLVEEGAVEMDGARITDPQYKIKKSAVCKIGKRRWVRIKME